jgi:transcriptional regulator with XRE-family HTH domain
MKAAKHPQMPDMHTLIKGWAKLKGTSLRKLALKTGKSQTYYNKILKKNDPKASLLLELTDILHVNLFEYYLDLLPEHKRITQREKMMKETIATLEKELETVKAERDKYWAAISRK